MSKHHHRHEASQQTHHHGAEEWLPIALAPRDGTIVEIQAQNGPTLCLYADLRGGDGPQWWCVAGGVGSAGAIAYPTHWRAVRIEATPMVQVRKTLAERIHDILVTQWVSYDSRDAEEIARLRALLAEVQRDLLHS